MTKKHIVFIINPHSGVDRQKAIQTAIDTKLDMNQYSYEIAHTQYAKHGIIIAKEAAEKGAYAVVAVGGDGSVNDVAAGLLHTDTALGIIAKGSGNGLARSLGLPLTEAEAIDIINKGKIITIDVGFAANRLFLSNAGTGFDALVASEFSKSKRRGFAIYSWLVTKNLWTYKAPEMEITIDGKTIKEKTFLVCAANGKQFGYNFQIAPEADCTDGLLDIIVIKNFPRILGGMLVLRAMSGTITKSPFVKHYLGKEITIKHAELNTMQTDGDAHPCGKEIQIRIHHAAQNVIVP
ncbi:MAG: diacylglycerol kinase family lipid kinase [Bacteroidetes bacterium]|nr:diacylglycerol kinase family lipid kinase [Bacteroidota bacterium]